MKTIIRQMDEENFKRVKNNIVKNYSKKMTQKDINDLLIECINQHKKRGYTDEQLSQMTFIISYVNYE